MSKKKQPAAAVVTPKKTPAPRKPKAKATSDSQLKKTILSAPQALNLEAANSFMRTTAFTLQNKVRTAMTGLSRIEKTETKTPSARLGLNYDSSIQPTSSNSFFSNPFNRFKIAFLTVVMVGGVAGYFYSDRVIDGFRSLGDSASSVAEDKAWVDGMMKQTNGIPEGNDKPGTLMPPKMMEETVVPAADEVPGAVKTTDVIPTEAPKAVEAPKAEAPKADAAKTAKTSPKAVKKGKAAKAKSKKAKGKSKVAHK